MSSPYGIKIFAEGINPILDIVAIHGVNGHREETWTVNDVNWLYDLLPSDIPNVRIYSWGYNDNTFEIQPHHLYNHAASLVSNLNLERKSTKSQKRPIVFIAHNLGGMILKDALIQSSSARNDIKSIQVSTYGIFYMGTPHQGESKVRLGELMHNAAPLFENPGWLQVQLAQYAPISTLFETKLGYERYPTLTATGEVITVVPPSSAAPPIWVNTQPIAMHTDHVNMVKFASKEDVGYKTIKGHLVLMTRAAPGKIRERWLDHDSISLLL